MCTLISELLSDGHAVIGSVDACASLVCVHEFIMHNHNCTAACGECVGTALIDLSKALDSIDHKLLKKLSA